MNLDRAFKVHTHRAAGNTNIAERMTKPKGFVLVGVRARFSAGSGDADMTLSVADGASGNTIATLHTIPDVGTGGEANIHVPFAREEIETGAWTIVAGEILKIDWTNPASGTMTWELEIRYQLPDAA